MDAFENPHGAPPCTRALRWLDNAMGGHLSRDNRRKLHPDLVPYAELGEEIKALDRLQVETLLNMLPPAAAAAPVEVKG